MGPNDVTGYCSFTKAIEHLADRWSLLIVRELATFGPRGFNGLAAGLPGRISRSVLADRLRRLEDLALVSRPDRQGLYRLTNAGAGLMPTLMAIRGWAATWMPDDPAMVERDPDVLVGWLIRRVDPDRLPSRQVVVEFRVRHRDEHRCWLVLRRGAEPYGCLEDPLLDGTRYVYVHGGITPVTGLASGSRAWAEAVADGSVAVAGDPDLTGRLTEWFRPAAPSHAGAEPPAAPDRQGPRSFTPV